MSTDNLNKINGNKDLYDRMCTWMADIEDPESVTDDEEVVNLEAFRNYMLDEAFSIMYDIYQTCEEN
tara:strand:- start:31 stop:231 length:201 start_codon:yes stop_codon:yes gene_type:complete